MGIVKTELYICTCDNCGCDYESDDLYRVFADETEADDVVRNTGDWIKEDGKYYCIDCLIETDENGKAIIDESRSQNCKGKSAASVCVY